MSNAHLRPCTGCSRHIRVSEGACPFCGKTLDAVFQASPPPRRPAARLARAALFAASATATVAVGGVAMTACGETTSGDGTLQAAPPYGLSPTPDDAGDGSLQAEPAYGIATFPTDAGPDADANLQSSPPYGIAPPPPDDAATDANANLRDADTDGDLMSEDAYGAVAFPDSSSDH